MAEISPLWKVTQLNQKTRGKPKAAAIRPSAAEPTPPSAPAPWTPDGNVGVRNICRMGSLAPVRELSPADREMEAADGD